MGKIRFGVVGAGWRAEFFTRVAGAAPDVFAVPVLLETPPAPEVADMVDL